VFQVNFFFVQVGNFYLLQFPIPVIAANATQVKFWLLFGTKVANFGFYRHLRINPE